MNAMRPIAILAALLLAAAPLTGCGKREKTGATLELNMDNSYRSVAILDSKNFGTKLQFDNRMLMSGYDTIMHVTDLMLYDTETEKTQYFHPKMFDDRQKGASVTANLAVELPDGNIGLLCEETLNGERLRYHLEVYDRDMQYIESREVPLTFLENANVDESRIAMDAQGNWYCALDEDGSANGWSEVTTIETYNSEYEKYGNIAMPKTGDFGSLISGEDGTVFASFSKFDEVNFETYSEVCRLHAENRSCSSEILINHSASFSPGENGYDFYYVDDIGMYGVKNGESTEVINWINSDFAKNTVYQGYFMENGACVLKTFSDGYWHAKRRSQEEIENTELISLAAVNLSENLVQEVIAYNRAENGYRIVVVDYSQYNTEEDPQAGYEKFKQDMLDGIVADMICTDGLNFESLASKGLFEDIYQLMEADAEFSQEDYLTNFFESLEYDGELQRLGFSYRIHTRFAKTAHVGEEEGMTPSEFLTLRENLPEEMDLFRNYHPREFALYHYLDTTQTCYIDRSTSECHYDSPEFIGMLEMLGSLPEDEAGMAAAAEAGEIPSYLRSNYAFREDRALLYPTILSEPIEYREIRRTAFYDEDMTFAGYAMFGDEGNGGIFEPMSTVSVNAQSKQQDAIWDFIKHLLSEDYQKKLDGMLPVQKAALEAKLTVATKMVGATADFEGPVVLGAAEQWEMDKLRAYIEGIGTCLYSDRTVSDIIREEIQIYLAGEATAQETAEMIQSRVSIYLSEQS